MKYDALTFDTQVFDTNSFNLDGGLLSQVKQFAGTPIRVLIADVVANEALRHLEGETLKVKEAVEKAHKRAILLGMKGAGEPAFNKSIDANELAKARLGAYFEEIVASVISCDEIKVRDVMRLYHSSLPPFATPGKKSEFPDAVALLTLEKWARDNNQHVLAVSGDRDWQSFAEKSEWIDVVPGLAEALSLLQQDVEGADGIVQRVLSLIQSRDKCGLHKTFERLLGEAMTNSSIAADGGGSYALDGEIEEISLDDFDLRDLSGELSGTVIQATRNTLVFNVYVNVTISAEASFSISTYDSVDKEYVSLGIVRARIENDERELDILVTLEGDIDNGKYELTEIEILDGLDQIDFGEIEADWGGPDDEPEDKAEYPGKAEPSDTTA